MGDFISRVERSERMEEIEEATLTYSHRKESFVGYPKINLTDGSGITMTIKLDRESKKVFAEMFMMPKYLATEWMFPKKKKRGTKRRKKKWAI